MISFGPFIDETIDFTKIENRGIFLVTGDTGSGKTTIFDAICVALYGKSSGDERTAESFKSDFDLSDQVMKIEFTFELRKKAYKVIRVPKQMRKKIRGDGFTLENGEVSLYEYRDGKEIGIDYSKQADDKIQELLGINVRQFRQIVMIPQGQFRKLITETTEEREKILKSIFDVYKYELFQRNLENKTSNLKNEISELKSHLYTEMGHIKCEKDSVLFTLIKAEEKNTPWIIEQLREYLENDQEQLRKIIENINEEKKKQDQIEKKLELYKKNNDLLNQYEKTRKEEGELQEKKEEFSQVKEKIEMGNRAFRIIPMEEYKNKRKKEYNDQIKLVESKELDQKKLEDALIKKENAFLRANSKENLDYLKTYEEKKAYLVNLIPKIQAYGKLKSLYDQMVKKYDREEKRIKQIKDEKNINQEQYKILLKEKEEIQSHSFIIEQVGNQISELNKKRELLDKLNQTCLDHINAYDKYQTSKKVYKQIIQQKMEFQKLYETNQKHWLEGQAGILAQELKEGDPCPVCGNHHHLKLAKPSNHVPSKEELDGLKKNLQIIDLKFNELQIAYATDQQNKNNKKEQLEAIIIDIKKTFDFVLEFNRDSIKDFYMKNVKILETLLLKKNHELEEYKKQKIKYEQRMDQIEVLSKNNEILEEELMIGENNLLDLFREKTTKEGEISFALEDLPKELPGERELLNEIATYQNKILHIENEIEETKKERDKNKNELDILRGVILEAKNILEDKEKLYEQELNDFESALEKNGFTSYHHFIEMKILEAELNDLKEKLTKYQQEVQINKQNLFILSKETEGLEKQDLSETQMSIQAMKEKIEVLIQNKNYIYIRINDNTDQIEKIKEIHKAYQIKIEEHSIMNDLSSVANGNAKGFNKITFERYILSSFLQEIVGAANGRLDRMTNGRYQLVRKDQANDRRKHTGLDLEIFDFYTGKSRDINTLSGGEGFKASLSLALGLADVAQAYAGGISLDTMFVDEGFGSLSTQSLDSAINCLMDLQIGGRLVGVISHVQELKDRIDTQIVVEKFKTGSTIKLEGL